MSRKSKKGTRQERTAPGPVSAAVGATGHWQVIGVCIFLTAMVWVVFGQTLRHDFVNYDDDVYVYGNTTVADGLTWKGVEAMFTRFECHFYHPLTMISLMLNYQLNGLQPGGYHLGNVLLHTASVIVLFLVLRRMTGALWRSAFVAAVFAIHPLRVESVAWVAERKDVLSGLFFMLTLWAYVRYVKKRSEAGAGRAALDYGLVLLFFAMSLLSKPSVVTLPFVLLLLDYWPLNRLDGQEKFSALTRLMVEKIPLFVLSVAASVVTVMAEGEAVTQATTLSLVERIGNPIVSYFIYIRQMFYPAGLTPFYPFLKSDLLVWKMILELVLLAGITAAALAEWRKRPYLLVGWLWYLGVLVPMIGIIQISIFAHADRFTYLAQIGLYVVLTWAVAELCAGWRYRRAVLGTCAMSILAVLIFCAHTQAAYWQNSELLWTHAIACDPNNIIAQNDLALVLRQQGNLNEAAVHFQKASEIQPDNPEIYYNLGNTLFQKGDMDKAIANYQHALQIKPEGMEIHNNLGLALAQKGSIEDAILHYRQALQIKPDYADAHYNLGNALRQIGRMDEAIAEYQKALQSNPDYLEAHYNLGNALALKGRTDEAIAHFQRVLQINHDYLNAQSTLAWILATDPQASLRNGNQAVELAERANQFAGGQDPFYLRVLAAAYAEAGRFDDAVRAGRKGMDLARASGRTDIVNGLSSELKFYEARQPFHEGNQ